MKVDVRLFSAGYCVQKRSMVIPKEAGDLIKFYATFALIKHKTHGYILFDTGYSNRFFDETKYFPFSIYNKITPVFLKDGDSACEKLIKAGVYPKDISYIILSHFHADHISGLKDFPNAKIICSKKGYEDIKNKKGLRALLKAFIPYLLPNDFDKRVSYVENFKKINISNEYTYFEYGYDLFGDGSIVAVFLEGHASGQIGLFVKTKSKNIFFVSDACWLSQSFEKNIMPSILSRLFFDNMKDYRKSLNKIHLLHIARPDILIIPSHCPKIVGETKE